MSLKKAKEYERNGRLEQAFSILEHLAKSGDAKAMLEISSWYKNGKYVKISPKKAENWCQKSLALGETEARKELEHIRQVSEIFHMIEEKDPSGEYLLAQAYEEGEILEKNFSKAVSYYKRAMEQKNILAISRLQELKDEGEESAQMLFLELGFDSGSKYYDLKASYGLCCQLLCCHPNNKRGRELLEEGVRSADADAEFYLGKYLLQMSENRKERERGIRLLKNAADSDNQEAMLLLAEASQNESGTMAAPAHSVFYYQKLHEMGNLTGTYQLAECYRTGRGISKEEETAEELLQFAADCGYEPAIASIEAKTAGWEAEGSQCFYGKGQPKNYDLAVEYYCKAYEKNLLSPGGIRNLAFCILNGLGTQKDVKHAMLLYQQAADGGDGKAQYFVGNCYRYGFNGYCKEDAAGVSYYKLSAAQGNPDAMYALAFCLLYGIGTDRDEEKGWLCCKMAAESGSREAVEMLQKRESGH